MPCRVLKKRQDLTRQKHNSVMGKILLIFGIVGAFSLGGVGGLWAQAFLLPYLSSHSAFQEWVFVQDWSRRTTVIRDVQKIVITKEEAVAQAVRGGESVAVGIQSSNGEKTINGSGFIAASDGFIVTLAEMVPEGYTTVVYVKRGQHGFAAQVLKRSAKDNLAVLKIEEKNLPTVGYASASVRIGNSVVMTAKVVEAGELVTIAQEGIVRSESENEIRTSIVDKSTLAGSVLVNIEGEIIGLVDVEPEGRVVGIPATVVREFSGL